MAVDYRAEPSILGDSIAAQACDRIDYDFTRLRSRLVSPESMSVKVAARARFFDAWTNDFLAEHERATVLHLGAGLDPRVWRIDPGPGVAWYDVDLPGIVDARRELFPDHANYRLIAASVTEPSWLERIPPEPPVLVIAQGLTMYLRPEDGCTLLRRITDRFARGAVILDTYSKLGVRVVNGMLKRQFGSAMLCWAIDDPRELERAVSPLRCTDVVSATSPAVVDGLPAGTAPRGSRLFARIAELVPPLRDLSLHVRYEFGAADRTTTA
ncbi:O-methyltransferase involved in polyketide biosynthesis [Catenuloplanes niger]|uniref:O-methyltransferase involved in polyketide biosynthesis n=1 Tax=Catenuloplanes niger TaxID=587534 RepID=A0AAE4A1H9_9ACTN|nr:O-methyltransferase involved in polyketide biosynthesis [Catenuloplanes niger]